MASGVSISITGLDVLGKDLEKVLNKKVKEIAQLTYDQARAHTPIRTGNARRNWTKDVRDRDFTIENRVPYIERLEQGWSKQAPNGIIMPTIKSVRGQIKK
jgi:hypothetical protein